MNFLGFPMERQLLASHRTERRVRTASLRPARNPISISRVGAAQAYAVGMEAFRKAYRG
ncbi:MAG TPA: hypothetical protein VIC34_16120 [Croceibacterium sp.]|jgi:hypothetical protein